MADDLKASQISFMSIEKAKKSLETQVHDLTIKLDDAETAALKGSKKALAGLKAKYDSLNTDYESQGKQYADLLKNYRKQERRVKELTFQTEEDSKSNLRMQDLVTKLQSKLKQYKFQAEESETQANESLAKFRKVNNELSAAEERAEAAEASLAKVRSASSFTTLGGASGSSSSYSYSLTRKSVFK